MSVLKSRNNEILFLETESYMIKEQNGQKDNHSSSEGEQEYGLKQRLETLEEKVAELLGNKEHQINCSDTLASIKSCPDGWLSYHESCYYFGRENINFEKAKELCTNHNAYVVQIETKTEDEFLRSFIKTFTDSNVGIHFWLGLTDKETEGVWRWYNNDMIATYLSWYNNEPNDLAGAEDCTVFTWAERNGWVDVPCTNTYRAFCEKKYKSA